MLDCVLCLKTMESDTRIAEMEMLGKELDEVTCWDGNPRLMVVWNGNFDMPLIRNVQFKNEDTGKWMVAEPDGCYKQYAHAAELPVFCGMPDPASTSSNAVDGLAKYMKNRLAHARRRVERGLDMSQNLTKYGGWEVGYWHGYADAIENVLDWMFDGTDWEDE